MLDRKLQLKENHTIAIINNQVQLELAAHQAASDVADVILVFVINEVQLRQYLGELKKAVANSKLAWVAYPKAKQLNTDINRDIIRSIANDNGLDPVRQIAIDEIWSALRLKGLGDSEASIR